MAIRVVHGRAVWHPPYSKVRLPRLPKKKTNYPRTPYSKPSKVFKQGPMVARDNKFYQTYTSTNQYGSTQESRVRFRDIFSPTIAHSGNFVDPTPHAYEHRQYWYPNGTRTSSASVDVGPFGEDYGLVLDESGAISQTAIFNQTLKKLYDQVRESSLNLSIDVAEWRQLDRMLVKMRLKTIPKLIALARRARRSRKPGMSIDQARIAIGNSWLELQYGWFPLLMSIFGIATFAQSIASHRKLIARSTSRSTWSVNNPAAGILPPVHWTTKHSRRCEIGITYRVSNPWLFDVSRAASFNPVAVAWELTPFSFVADWLIDIGGYLELLEQSFFAGLTFERGHVTHTDKVEIVGAYKGSWSTNSTIDAPFRMKVTRLSRAPLTGPPRPYLPRFEPRLGWQRLVSAGALLNQLLSPVPRKTRK